MPRCEWDWPPERRYLDSSPLIDADRPCGFGVPLSTDRRIAHMVVKVIVGALKMTVVVALLLVWLIYTLVRI
jgi:hypothetical protein